MTTSEGDPGRDYPGPFPDPLPIVVSPEAIRRIIGHAAPPETRPACTAGLRMASARFLRAPFLHLRAAAGSQSSNGPRTPAALRYGCEIDPGG
jgi:hypothetical protein